MVGSNAKSVLIVDDDKDLRFILGDILSDEGYRVLLAASGEKALELLGRESVNLLVTDMKMPGISGQQLFRDCSKRWPHIPVVILTAHGTVEEALEMIRQGAYDYIAKPYNTQDLLMRISRALEREQLVVENRALREQLQVEKEYIFGDEPAVKEVMARVDAVAGTDFSVVLIGESGTGKEVLAREVHRRSKRSQREFVPVNCGAIPRELFESELFGNVKGAFTGATTDRRGLFEEASGGSLFLDEISEISPDHQVKLLRAVQEQEIKRVGDNTRRPVDVRLIAATNRDLMPLVKAGSFREDLYYRICVMPIRVPPLRQRRGDILPLAMHFLVRERSQTGKHVTGFTRAAMEKLLAYEWPGNIRELENRVKQSLILASDELIDADDLLLDDPLSLLPAQDALHQPSPGSTPAPPAARAEPLSLARKRFERQYLIDVLQRHRGNATMAAREAGKHRSEFYYLLKKHGLSASDYRDGGRNRSEEAG
ncbi:MAG: sigma-54-dependent transcriptional regulator [Acidobacteriota bacterium]